MLSTEISKELKTHIETNQTQLKTAIKNHQFLIAEFRNCRDPGLNKLLKHNIEEAQQQIIIIGLEQKSLVEKLRREYKFHQKNAKINAGKNGIEERRFNLSTALNRARKQNIITRSTSVQSASPSEDSEALSAPSTPEPVILNPVVPQDITQTEFLTYFGLATHELYKEIQNKRAERKRRRTANPQFLYTKGWDISKRKRNLYLASNVSPPNTRQAVKNRNRVPSPPSFKPSRPTSPVETKKVVNFPAIPNLPSGLTIERINQARSTADNKVCIECRLPGNLNICEMCTNGFHVGCYNRPLVQQPKHCPKCYKELKIGSPGASANVIDLTEKLKEKQELLERNKELTAELTQLQDRHSQLTISLKSQKTEKEGLLTTQQSTEDKIKQILTFITSVKEAVPETDDVS